MDSGNIFSTENLIKMAVLVVLLPFVTLACGMDDNETEGNSPVTVMHTSSVIPEELRGISADAFRTGIPVSHYFGNLEVSLFGEYCDHSGRELRSRRYGAVALTPEGKVLRFRSVENLVWYMDEKGLVDQDFQVIGIVDFISARQIMKPGGLMFHLSRNLPSPGGSWVSALDPEADPSLLYNIGEAYPGTRHSWEEVRTFFTEKKEGI